jgi:hypothetical protein
MRLKIVASELTRIARGAFGRGFWSGQCRRISFVKCSELSERREWRSGETGELYRIVKRYLVCSVQRAGDKIEFGKHELIIYDK